jgi:hypothetical protein
MPNHGVDEAGPWAQANEKASKHDCFEAFSVEVVGWGLLKVTPEPAKTLESTSKKSGFVPRFVPRIRAHFRVLFTFI